MFFQTLVAGDSWGSCAIPLIERTPLSFALFAGSLVTVQLGLTNLILAVIVEKAQEAHEDNKIEEAARCTRAKEAAESRLKEMCEEIDRDADGKISLIELQAAYRDHREMKAVMSTLDIDEHDLDTLFHIMDSDDSGDLTYQELVNCIHKSDRDDVKRQIMMLRLQIGDIWGRVREHLEVKLDWICSELHSQRRLSERSNHDSSIGEKRLSERSDCPKESRSKAMREKLNAGQKDGNVNAASRSPFAELRMQLDQLSQHLHAELATCALTLDAKEREIGDLLQKRGRGWEDAQHVWGITHDDETEANLPAVQQKQSASGPGQNPRHDDALTLQETLNSAAATSLSGTQHEDWKQYLK